MRSVGQLALAQSRARRGGFLFVVGGGQLSSTYFGRVDDHRVSGVSYCGYHGLLQQLALEREALGRCTSFRSQLYNVSYETSIHHPPRLNGFATQGEALNDT